MKTFLNIGIDFQSRKQLNYSIIWQKFERFRSSLVPKSFTGHYDFHKATNDNFNLLL